MADIAKLVRLTPQGGVEIDGEPFPWFVTEDGAQVHVSWNSLVTVTIAIPCERVEAEDLVMSGKKVAK
jgi:hypothetical protein